MAQIKKFIECLIPVTKCNLRCSYCYIIQQNRRDNEITTLDYSLDTIQKALTKERFHGICYFSICGAGETLIPAYVPELIKRILDNGHFVNVTTNGTLSKRFDEIINILSKDALKRLHFAFSFHYLELKNRGLLPLFFENVKKIQKAGCSFVIQLNLCDEYIPYIDEISHICQEKVGALPQVAATRKEINYPDLKVELLTDHSAQEYANIGKVFNSPLFEFTMKNFNVMRKEFCYAGAWSYTLNLKNGELRRCYASGIKQNIFKKVDTPIMELPIGKNCSSPYCMNSSHFMALGVIPELSTPTYAELRNRQNASWYSQEMEEFLSSKLYDNNEEYGHMKRIFFDLVSLCDRCAYMIFKKLVWKHVISIKRKIKKEREM